ncbi:MAG TPA: virulence factor [Candidatus Limnocylindrales bacterium]|nr:virulence factor [Candidatus Limnocylindrales bacterium]
MATLTVIWWRDIPAQVLARDGRRSSKVQLHPRFQVAIDKAASRAGKRAYNDYIEEWRKVARGCGEDLEAEVNAEVERLETEYDRHRLAELIQSGGVAGGPALPPAHDETQRSAKAETEGTAAARSDDAPTAGKGPG